MKKKSLLNKLFGWTLPIVFLTSGCALERYSPYYNPEPDPNNIVITEPFEPDRKFFLSNFPFHFRYDPSTYYSFSRDFDGDGIENWADPWPYDFGPYIDMNGNGFIDAWDFQISGFGPYSWDSGFWLFNYNHWHHHWHHHSWFLGFHNHNNWEIYDNIYYGRRNVLPGDPFPDPRPQIEPSKKNKREISPPFQNEAPILPPQKNKRITPTPKYTRQPNSQKRLQKNNSRDYQPLDRQVRPPVRQYNKTNFNQKRYVPSQRSITPTRKYTPRQNSPSRKSPPPTRKYSPSPSKIKRR